MRGAGGGGTCLEDTTRFRERLSNKVLQSDPTGLREAGPTASVSEDRRD